VVSFLLDFPTYLLLLSHESYICLPSYSLWLGHSNNIWRRVHVMKLIIQSHTISSVLGRNIVLSTLFSNDFILYSPLMSGNKFHTHTEQQAKLLFCIFYSLCISTADTKTKGSEWNGSKHYPKSICSSFPHESNFNSLLSFRTIWNSQHSHRIC
jgi:hypothetical protein